MSRKKITKGTVSFVLRKEKINTKGLIPVYCKYSYKGIASFTNTGHSILPLNWDDDSKEPIYISKPIAKKLAPDVKYSLFLTNNEVQDIISHFNELELRIKSIEQDLDELNSRAVIESLKNYGKPTEDTTPKLYFDDWVKSIADENKEKMKHSTWKVYNTMNHLILDYEKGLKTRVLLKDVDYTYMKHVCIYMNNKGLLNSTIAKRLRHLKGFVKAAIKHGKEVNLSYQSYSWIENELDVIAFTMEELDKVEQLDLSSNPKLERVRDVFLFACHTGLRFSDFSKLKKEHLKNGYLKFTSTKTKSLQTVPLSRVAMSLIDKYSAENSDHIFPVESGQKFNEKIKDVCELAQVNESIEKVRYSGAKQIIEVNPKYKLISAHTARRTFVTLSLELGMQAEEIMNITGHKSYQSFKKYVKITEKRAKEALLSAWDK